MRRLFPALATIAVASIIAGLAAAVSGVGHTSRTWVALLATLAVHGITLSYLDSGRRRVEATASRLGLPDWVGAQLEKVHIRIALLCGGFANLAAVLTLVPAGLDAGPAWRLAVDAGNLGFQVMAFACEFIGILALARWARELAAIEP